MLANVDNAASRAYRVQKYLLLFTDGTSSLSLGWDVSYKKKEIRHTIMITTFISCLSAKYRCHRFFECMSSYNIVSVCGGGGSEVLNISVLMLVLFISQKRPKENVPTA